MKTRRDWLVSFPLLLNSIQFDPWTAKKMTNELGDKFRGRFRGEKL